MIKRALCFLGVSLMALGLSSCETFTGGGWIESSTDSAKKATFGFNFHCTDTVDGVVITGDIQYQDKAYTVTAPNGRGAKLSVHAIADPTPLGGFTCEQLDELADEFLGDPTGLYTGTYTPQPPNLGDGGFFELFVQDLGKQGPSKEDIIAIELFGGVFDGYANIGTLAGGQATMHLP